MSFQVGVCKEQLNDRRLRRPRSEEGSNEEDGRED